MPSLPMWLLVGVAVFLWWVSRSSPASSCGCEGGMGVSVYAATAGGCG